MLLLRVVFHVFMGKNTFSNKPSVVALNEKEKKSKKNWEVFFRGKKQVFLGLQICYNLVYVLWSTLLSLLS
jgi:hypothetical protein